MLIIDLLYSILSFLMVVSGLAIIFGILRIINMAHGEFIMLGAYSTWLVYQLLPSLPSLAFVVSLLCAPLFCGFIGLLTYLLVVKHVKTRLIDSILATWGVSLVLKYGITAIAGASALTVTLPFTGTLLTYPLYRIVVMALICVVLVCLYLLFFQSRFGLMARAIVCNPTLSITSGIYNDSVRMQAFIIGCSVAGLTGAIIAPTLSISPLLGESYLIPAFLAILLGGMDSLIAPLLGGTLFASTENILSKLSDPVSAQILTLLLVIILLKLFPNGLINRLLARGKS